MMDDTIDKKKKLHVVAYSIPFAGHYNPILTLCEELAKRGHSVTFYTSDFVVNKLQVRQKQRDYTALFNISGLSNGTTKEDIDRFNPTHPKHKEGPFYHFAQVDESLLATAVKEAQLDYDLILTDMASFAAHLVSKAMNIRLFINAPSSFELVPKFLTIEKNHIVRFLFRYLGGEKEFKKLVLNKIIPISRDENNTTSLYNTVWGLDYPMKKKIPSNIKLIGSLSQGGKTNEMKHHLTQHYSDLLTFIDSARNAQQPIIYITLGSVVVLTDRQLKILYNKICCSDYYVIWSLSKKDYASSFGTKQLPSNVYIRDWIPQKELLAEKDAVKVVVTHAGWGGTMECMQFAKPVLCLPFFGDQPSNASLLVKRGCGLQLNPNKPKSLSKISKKLKKILHKYDQYYSNCKVIRDAMFSVGNGATNGCDIMEGKIL